MVEDVGAVIAQIANGIVAVVRIVERANAQAGEAIQIQHFFEIANFIGSQIEHAKRYEAVEADANGFDVIAGEVNVL